jgi:hypothetical protein
MAGSPLHTRFSANINQSVFLNFFLTNDDFLLAVFLFVRELQRPVAKGRPSLAVTSLNTLWTG